MGIIGFDMRIKRIIMGEFYGKLSAGRNNRQKIEHIRLKLSPITFWRLLITHYLTTNIKLL